MKKIIEIAALAALILALAGLCRHFELNKEIGELLKSAAGKFAPWVNTVYYS